MRQMSLLKRNMSYGEGAQGRVKAVSSKQLFSILIGQGTLHVLEHNHISIVDISKFFLILEIHPRFYSQLRSWTRNRMLPLLSNEIESRCLLRVTSCNIFGVQL